MRLGEERGYGLGVEDVGDDEVAIAVEGFDLGGREVWSGGGHDNGGVGAGRWSLCCRFVSIET